MRSAMKWHVRLLVISSASRGRCLGFQISKRVAAGAGQREWLDRSHSKFRSIISRLTPPSLYVQKTVNGA